MRLTPAILCYGCPGVLFAGVLLQLAVTGLLSSRAKGILAALCCAPALAGVLALSSLTRSGEAVEVRGLIWDGPAAIVLHVDALSVLFAFMATAIGLIVLLYSIEYMADDNSPTRFYALMLTFIAGLVGLVFCANMLLMYVCWEVMGLCSFGLVGFWYTNPEAVSGARKVLLMTHLAGYGLLAGILLIYMRTSSMLWTDPNVSKVFTGIVFVIMLVALAAKSVQFPLHTWIPDAMAAPTPVSALLHAACYVKAGVYLAARMHSFGAWPVAYGTTMVWVGTATMLVGAVYAMVQNDLKRMLAYSTVSQIGYMITGIGIGTPLGITAGLFHCLNHGFFKGGLFLTAGAVQHAAGTRDMNELGGLASRMPRTSAVWFISMASMMGVPLLSGFASKWMLYTAALQSGLIVPGLIAWLASIGTVFYCAKATSAVFLGPPAEGSSHIHEAPRSMQLGMGLLAAGTIALSVAPQIAVNYILNPIVTTLGLGPGVQVTWFGFATQAGAWWITGGFVLALVSVVVGALIYFAARPATGVVLAGNGSMGIEGSGIFTGGEQLAGPGRLSASDFSEIIKTNWKAFLRWTDVDSFYLSMWRVMSSVSTALNRLTLRAERKGIRWTAGLAVAFLCSVRWLIPRITTDGISEFQHVPPVLVFACAVTYCTLCVSASALAGAVWRQYAPLMIVAGSIAVSGLVVFQPWLRIALLEVSAGVALWLVWDCTTSRKAKWTYLSVVLASGVALLLGDVLLSHGYPDWGRALLLSALCAVIPLSLWLLRIAEELPALVLGLLIAVVDVAAFGELYLIAQAAPWMVMPRKVWLSAAVFSALLGSSLMLVQRNLKRLLVLSTLEDFGFVLLGISTGTPQSMSGALTVAVVHALAKALFFISLSTAEEDGNLGPDSAGLASLYPWSGAAFVFGIFCVLGVPPTMGFSGRWKLYEAACQAGPMVPYLFVTASACALIGYTMALARFWWGPADTNINASKEPLALRGALLTLVLLLLAAGLWPNAVAFSWRQW